MIKSFKCAVYDITFHCGFNVDYNKLQRYAGKFKHTFTDDAIEKIESGGGTTGTVDGSNIWIFFREKPLRDSTIVHEGFHAAYLVLNRAGISLEKATNEVYAYYITFVFENIKRLQKK